MADYGRQTRARPDGRRSPRRLTAAMHSIVSLRGRMFGPALHICAACGGDYANPAAWEEAGPAAWVVSLRCGACGHERDAHVDEAAARRFNRALDRGFNAIERAAERLERELMCGWIETFRLALERDLIDAADF